MAVVAPRTNGFLFSDLRDYTRFVEAHGDAAAAAYLDRYRRLVRREVAEFGGAEIKTEGDSFYVVFPSASGAVQCGLAIVRATKDEAETGGPPIRVGVGVHAGETIETEEGFVGSAVNIAARVCSQAGAGEVLVTDTVRGLIRTSAQVRFIERGARRLKGIDEPVILYRVEPLGEGHQPGTARRRRVKDVGRSTSARVAILVAVAAALILAGAVGASIYVGGMRADAGPSPTPGASPSLGASSTPSSPADPTARPRTAEDELMAQLPSELRDTCVRTEAESERLGTVASVRCDLPPGAGAETAWYDRYETLQEVSDKIFRTIDAENLPQSECTRDQSRGHGTWRVGSTHSGQMLCYSSGGRLWVMWSYDAERIVVRAVRDGDTPEDWEALYDWWSQVRLFLQ